MDVSAFPMSICPHAMSKARPSNANDFVRPVIACFVAVYGAVLGRGLSADTDPLLMIRPPLGTCCFMSLMASREHKNVPVRFVPTHRSQASVGSSSTGTCGAPTPALLKSKSHLPKRSWICPNTFATSAASETLQEAHQHSSCGRPSACCKRLAVSSSASMRRPNRAMESKPAFLTKAIAAARPTPLPAPVTTATFRGCCDWLCAAEVEPPRSESCEALEVLLSIARTCSQNSCIGGDCSKPKVDANCSSSTHVLESMPQALSAPT
mmetsp:Transcript_20268/g.47331  ORF Transcript_20268/g.47331 Transcript_20268/m.47331 type:complete len:266 (-) Transcript_20268:1001-1798(-)